MLSSVSCPWIPVRHPVRRVCPPYQSPLRHGAVRSVLLPAIRRGCSGAAPSVQDRAVPRTAAATTGSVDAAPDSGPLTVPADTGSGRDQLGAAGGLVYLSLCVPCKDRVGLVVDLARR